MNRKLIIAATVAILGLTSCSAQQRQIVENLGGDPAPTKLVGDPPIQGSCLAGEHEIDSGTCLPLGTDTPPPTQPAKDPNAPLTCPAGEVIVDDPSPHCVPDPCLPGESWVEGHCVVD